jgi:hypothetical protein
MRPPSIAVTEWRTRSKQLLHSFLRVRETRSTRRLPLRDNGTGVARDVDVESRMHVLIRIIRGRVFYHRDLVAKFSAKANGHLDAGICNEADDDQLMDAVPLELQIQISSVRATGRLIIKRIVDTIDQLLDWLGYRRLHHFRIGARIGRRERYTCAVRYLEIARLEPL